MVGRVADVVVLSGEGRRFLETSDCRHRAPPSATLVVGPVPHDTAVRRRFSE